MEKVYCENCKFYKRIKTMYIDACQVFIYSENTKQYFNEEIEDKRATIPKLKKEFKELKMEMPDIACRLNRKLDCIFYKEK